MLEDGGWNVASDLLGLSRLRRRERELRGRYGDTAADAYAGGVTWGIYQLLDKLCPTVYLWERRA